jgi:DNA-binding LytR/AlgR family response regulator
MRVPLSCIVVDDSDLDRKSVENEIDRSSDLKLVGSFDNCIEALSFFNAHHPDILFVDIDMPDINGLEFIRTINNSCTINVIISAHPEYALEGFLLKVFDFILKPVETDRFNSTTERLLDFTQLKSKAEAYDVLFEQEEVVFKDGLQTIKLDVNQILYLEAFGDYTKIVTDKKVHLTLTTLSKFVESLPIGKFVRIHRSYAVLKGKVNEIGNKEILISDKVLPIGKTYYKSAKKELGLSQN